MDIVPKKKTDELYNNIDLNARRRCLTMYKTFSVDISLIHISPKELFPMEEGETKILVSVSLDVPLIICRLGHDKN